MLLEIHPENPDTRKIRQVAEVLSRGGIIAYPTDTVYSFGCDLMNKKALEKLARMKKIKLSNANFSLICFSISSLGDYTKQISNPTFKVMNSALPGPYTFILKASNRVPKLFGTNKKTVGIRIPDHEIARGIVNELGNPIATTSVAAEDEILEYTTDPYEIYERYQHQVDLVIDGGYGSNIASTVLDCSTGVCEVIREGSGNIDTLF